MDSINQYILSVIATAIICATASSICNKEATHGKLIRLLCGILLTLSLASPLIRLDLKSVDDWYDNIQADAAAYVYDGVHNANNQRSTVIKATIESYILDKAASLNMDVNVEVILQDADLPVPESVHLYGSASPYAKNRMEIFLTDELGIPEANQQWN